MTEAQKILLMIETVRNVWEDSQLLNDIDLAVQKYLGEHISLTEYTRSRDALKDIRPDGWGVGHHCEDKWHTEMRANCYQIGEKGHNIKRSPVLPTEELAELHAIIQAIEWERENPEVFNGLSNDEPSQGD